MQVSVDNGGIGQLIVSTLLELQLGIPSKGLPSKGLASRFGRSWWTKLIQTVLGGVLFAGSVSTLATPACGQLNAIRNDQISRLQSFVLDAILPSGLVRDALVLDPTANHFHPATPDAAGFALVSLSAFDQLGSLPNAEQHVIDILRSHAGMTPGVNPARSADGHFVHFMNIDTGATQGGGWDDSFSPISSALLVSGAQFAANHFSGNATIAALASQLTSSVDFNAAIHPSLDGRIYLDQTMAGGGSGPAVENWNEFMLVASLALRQTNNDRAIAVKDQWLNPANAPQLSYAGNSTLADNNSVFAPAFWVQQQHFFNGDFRHSAAFEDFFFSQQAADQAYSSTVLNEPFRYGLSAGPGPGGYHADSIGNHPATVFSPETVTAWGDLDAFLEFHAEQLPTSDPRYRYGLVRQSATLPTWVPNDAGLVDHLFLLFGLVESLEPDFFSDRIFAPILAGDYNLDGIVDAADYTVWQDTLGSSSDLRADGDLNGIVGMSDYALWLQNFGTTAGGGSFFTVPEPGGLRWLFGWMSCGWLLRRRSFTHRT